VEESNSGALGKPQSSAHHEEHYEDNCCAAQDILVRRDIEVESERVPSYKIEYIQYTIYWHSLAFDALDNRRKRKGTWTAK
jgi:hypothetical protein